MKNWKSLPLGELCKVVAGGTPSRTKPEYFDGDIPWVKIGDMLQGHITTTDAKISRLGLENSSAKLLPKGTVLISIFATIGRTAVLNIEAATNQAIAGITPLNFNVLQSEYLRYFLDNIAKSLEQRARGVAQLNINSAILKTLQVPLPPITEQQRIAEILDRTQSLISKRKEAIALLDTLTQSIFLEMFGDPVTNPKGWKLFQFQKLLSIPLRNGLSPSNTGKVMSKLLTLAAITGNHFNESAYKTSTFQSKPPIHQCVDPSDFLICRGNGNLQLVGRGHFPTKEMAEVAFPDTIIAAKILPQYIERAFLQHIWNSNAVRRQIELLARTTNGTFKVNQTMLESIMLVLPPLPLQKEFAQRVEAVEKLKATHRASLSELEALFASLQHRAFRGEL